MKINFVNQTTLETKEYEKLIKKIFKPIKQKNVFSIIFVSNEEIQRINNEFRNINKVTDVISFALNDNDELNDMASDELGDIFICLDRAFSQAKEYGHSIAREVGFLAVHGFLHLSGYDHQTPEDEKLMCAKQEEILALANLKRE